MVFGNLIFFSIFCSSFGVKYMGLIKWGSFGNFKNNLEIFYFIIIILVSGWGNFFRR